MHGLMDQDDSSPATDHVTVGGLDIAYLELGEGPLAVCLHGFPDTAWSWRHLMPALADAGYRAVAPFLRGYAPTAVPADHNGQAGAHVVDVCGLHDALGGTSESVLIGHDWGAVIAYGCGTFAADRWHKVVAAGVPPGPVMGQAFMDYDQLRRSWYMFFFQSPLADLVVAMNDLEFVTRLWRDWSPGYEGATDAARATTALSDPAALATALDTYRSAFGAGSDDPAFAEAQAATASIPPQPCLYLHGADDECIGVEYGRQVGPLLAAGSQVEIIDGAGHFLHLERPEIVHSAILGFLAD